MKKIIYLVLAAFVSIIPISCNGEKGYVTPVLAALNIKGKPKVVCYDDTYSFGFKPDGTTSIGDKGSNATLVSEECGYFALDIVDGHLTSIQSCPIMMAGYKIEFTAYDEQNRVSRKLVGIKIFYIQK